MEPEQFEELASAPRKTIGDEGTVEERSVSELIDADRYASAKQAAKAPYGLRLARIRKPGTP